MTETAQRATLILPAKGAFEKNGTTVGLGGDLLPVNASLKAPDFVRSDLEMLVGLADQLDVVVAPADEIHRTIIALVAKTAVEFSFGDKRFGDPVASGASAARPILSGGGTWLHDPWLAEMRA